MSIQLQIEEMSGYLAARFVGEGKPDEVFHHFKTIAEQCNRANHKRLLLDITAAQGKFSTVDSYKFGETSRIFASHNLKVATVARPEQFDPQEFGELVARNRGINLCTFTDFQAAEEWLLE